MTQQNNSAFPLMISIVVMDPMQLASVYALLGGTSHAALGSGNEIHREPTKQEAREQAENIGAAPSGAAGQSSEQSGGAGASQAATDVSGEIDAHGHPWSAELHASTKGKTKDGLWRMKVGVTRPDPLPGFPVESGAGTGTSTAGTEAQPTPSATSQAATDQGTGPAPTSPAPTVEEDDEFAAFRQAAANSDATDQAAAASVPARTFTDADLGALCNQAAVKLGDPSPVKEIIAKYTPEGEVAHSRNIPEDKRAQFAAEVEAKAGIEFVG